MSDPTPIPCPPGQSIWLLVTLPAGIDCRAQAMQGYPEFVRQALDFGSHEVRVCSTDPRAGAVQALGERVQRYFRRNDDPYTTCSYDRAGLLCRHDPSCSE